MNKKHALLQRLENIGKVLAKNGDVLALFGLGSVGTETDRIDDYSDLDFFVVTAPGCKQRYIDQVDWLQETYPLAYAFKNCDIGYKILFEDGIYGEFAVFEETELEHASYTGGRMIWKAPHYTNDGIVSGKAAIPSRRAASLDHAVGEALTNLYVGLGRYARGEKLSALRFVESYAIDSILSILHLVESEVDYYPDVFGNERRVETRFPQFAAVVRDMMQGYEKVPESATHVLNFLENIYPINLRMSLEIRALAEQCMSERDLRA
ncbi:conserved hypothetical protein [Paenibacillus curdlanolyticus YK9]|uniref:DNA polymerase beta domain protein region n=1 Tax=Paenibacillus curdlanolyticus YK9 TaxID=717606 RepID=E0IGD4_9BACL|nr:hypothetical protein [Paenibacillus curdlanolyticus]EFM08434.1 conserved hypothetical protein [Paenibacillus curdlanolyticus YK9]